MVTQGEQQPHTNTQRDRAPQASRVCSPLSCMTWRVAVRRRQGRACGYLWLARYLEGRAV